MGRKILPFFIWFGKICFFQVQLNYNLKLIIFIFLFEIFSFRCQVDLLKEKCICTTNWKYLCCVLIHSNRDEKVKQNYTWLDVFYIHQFKLNPRLLSNLDSKIVVISHSLTQNFPIPKFFLYLMLLFIFFPLQYCEPKLLGCSKSHFVFWGVKYISSCN